MIRFRCQQCGKKLKAEEDIVGRRVRCTRCESIETVPESDNLVKPKFRANRLATQSPQISPVKSRTTHVDADDLDLENALEIDESSPRSSSSLSNPSIDTAFQPRFNLAPARDSRTSMRRWLLIGFSGLFLIAVVVVVFNFSRFNDMRRRFSTDYQKLPEVVYYKNNLMRLEKSRRMMYVAGRNSIAALPGAADQFEELEDYNRSVESFTKNAALIKEVEALFRAGEDQQARARLVNTAKEMIAMREEVESRTKSYLDASD